MASEHTEFWMALLAQGQDTDQRVRLWNGYLGWRCQARKNPPIDAGRS